MATPWGIFGVPQSLKTFDIRDEKRHKNEGSQEKTHFACFIFVLKHNIVKYTNTFYILN